MPKHLSGLYACGRLSNHNNMCRQDSSAATERLANVALDAIAVNGAWRHLAGNHDPKARTRGKFAVDVDHEMPIAIEGRPFERRGKLRFGQ